MPAKRGGGDASREAGGRASRDEVAEATSEAAGRRGGQQGGRRQGRRRGGRREGTRNLHQRHKNTFFFPSSEALKFFRLSWETSRPILSNFDAFFASKLRQKPYQNKTEMGQEQKTRFCLNFQWFLS